MDHGAIDEQVARLHPEIKSVAERFVLLRIGNMRGLDLALFEFDYDLTWAALMFDSQGNVLGRFGAATPTRQGSTTRCPVCATAWNKPGNASSAAASAVMRARRGVQSRREGVSKNTLGPSVSRRRRVFIATMSTSFAARNSRLPESGRKISSGSIPNRRRSD
jgi:hypothetical protein